MFKQKRQKWTIDLRILRDELSDLFAFEQRSRIFAWAFSRHPELQRDDLAVFGEHFYDLERAYSVIAIRRIIRRSDKGVSLLCTLKDFNRFRKLALRAFPMLASETEINQDIAELDNATKGIIDLSDTIFAHVDRNQRRVSLLGLYSLYDGTALPVVLRIGAKYVRLLADYEGDFEGEIPSWPADPHQVRRFFGSAFIADNDEIPEYLLRPRTL